MLVHLLFFGLTLTPTSPAHAIDDETLRRGRELYERATRGPSCAERLAAQERKREWLHGLGYPPEFIGVEGPATSDPVKQSLLDGSIFANATRPIMVTGNIADGKSYLLRALARYLAARDVPRVHLIDLHWPGERPKEYHYLQLDVRPNPSLAKALKIPSKWRVPPEALDHRQQLFAAKIMEFLELNRDALKGKIVIVDPSILYPENQPDPNELTTLNLLDRIVWLQRTDGTRFAVAVNLEFLEDLPARAAHQGTDPTVLREFDRVKLEFDPMTGPWGELRALFPGKDMREIKAILDP